MALRGTAQGRNGCITLIRHDAHISDFTAQAAQQRCQEEAVGVVDGTGWHVLRRFLARHHQLIAGRKQGHARTADHAEFGHAHAGGQPQCGGAQALATRQHYSTAGDVFTRTANPLSRSRHAVDGHARQALRAVCGGAVFLHDHGVGTGRNRGSGKDARSGAGEQLGSGRAGGNALGHGQRGTGSGHIGATHRVAVHRAVVLRWHMQVRHHIGRQHTAIGLQRGNLLSGLQGRYRRQQLGQRIIQRQQRLSGCRGHG